MNLLVRGATAVTSDFGTMSGIYDSLVWRLMCSKFFLDWSNSPQIYQTLASKIC